MIYLILEVYLVVEQLPTHGVAMLRLKNVDPNEEDKGSAEETEETWGEPLWGTGD